MHYLGTDKSTPFGEAYQKSADTNHLLCYPDRGRNSPGHYDLLFYEGEEDKPTDLPKVGRYVIIRKGKTVWYPSLVMNADNDGNVIEVKFMYPSTSNSTLAMQIPRGAMWKMLSLCVNLQSVIRKNCICYHTIPYHTVPYRTVPYHTIPYHTIPYHTIQYS